MIIGKNFIWLHFPKCAGSFTEKILRELVNNDEIKFDPIDPKNVIWHQNVYQREQLLNIDLSSKDVICNFRRLPNWIISRIQYEEIRSGIVTSKELYTMGCFFEHNKLQSNAEAYLKLLTERKIHHWIRVENLEEDFINVFSKYIDFITVPDSSLFRQKFNSSSWGEDINKWFDYDDLVKLYTACPNWAKLEKKLYGNLLID